MQSIVLNLNELQDKEFYIEGYGFFFKRIPSGVKAFINVDGDANTTRDITNSRVIRYNEKFRRFKFVSLNTVNEPEFKITIAETQEDFNQFPTNDNADIEGNITQTNILLDSIDTKITKADTDNVKLTEDNIGLAKETTQGAVKTAVESLDSKTIKTDTDNIGISADNVGLAKETTQQAIDTKLGNLDTKIIKADTDNIGISTDNVGLNKETTQQAIDTKLGNLDTKIIKADTDNIQISADNVGLAKETTQQAIDNKIIYADTNNTQRFIDNAVKNGQAFFWMKKYTGNQDIIIENPSSSGKTLYIYNFVLNNTGTSNVTVNFYKNSSTDATDVTFIPNKKIDDGNTRIFTLKENGTITNGTLIGNMDIQANNFYKQSYDSFSIIAIPEGKTLHFNINASDTYNLLIDIIEN